MRLRPYQTKLLDDCRASYGAGAKATLMVLPTGGGKCLGRDTSVLMYDGRIKKVQDVRVGDLLMGPDSLPRAVVSTCSGVEPLYRVVPTKGDSYVVNESHILSLKKTGVKAGDSERGEIVNIAVTDYLAQTGTFKHIHKGWRAAVDFQAQDSLLKIDPYFFGLWLGDGNSDGCGVTTGDAEISEYVAQYYISLGLNCRSMFNSPNSCVIEVCNPDGIGKKNNCLINALRSYNVFKNKHIPMAYKMASRDVRLKILAGIIDTDGSYTGKGFDLCLKSERLMDDVLFVARSLGFACYKKDVTKRCQNGAVGEYFRTNISGYTDQIPCLLPRKKSAPRLQKKDVLVTGITLEPIGPGEYFGFELNGPDRLFLLGDFTVTHNTAIMAHAADGVSRKGRNAAIIAHRQELILQTSMTLAKQGIWHGIVAPDGVVRESVKAQLTEIGRSFFNSDAPVQCASVQTLVRRNRDPFKFLFIDEAHHCGAGSWLKVIETNSGAHILGVTATPTRLDGKALGRAYGGVFDVMVEGPEAADLMADGYLTTAEVWGPEHQLDFSEVRDFETKAGLAQLAGIIDKPTITGDAIAHYSRICPSQPAIAFCITIEHAQNVARDFRAAGYRFQCIDGTMSDGDRRAAIRALGEGRLHGLTSCEIVNEGTDIPVVTAAILLRPTQSLGLHRQQCGRVLRPVYARGFDLETQQGRLDAIAASQKPRAIILDHVGNCNLHGLPEDPQEWTLEGRKKKKKGEGLPPEPKARTCHSCHAIYNGRLRSCPACGTPAELTQREIEYREGELVRIERAESERLARAAHWQRVRAQHDAKTEDSLIALYVSQGADPKKAAARARHIIRAREAKQGIDTTPKLVGIE